MGATLNCSWSFSILCFKYEDYYKTAKTLYNFISIYPHLLKINHAILDILNPAGGKVMLPEPSEPKMQLNTNVFVQPAVSICYSGC